MNNVTTTAEQPRIDRDNEPSPVLRFIFIVGIFVIVGPPIGGVTVWATLAASSLIQQGVLLPEAPGMLFLSIIYAYPLGAPFALAAGVIHAVAAIRWRTSSVLVPIIAALTVNAIGLALFVWMKPWMGGYGSEFVSGLVIFLPPSLVASLVCWRISRGLLRMS
jgi:hypothetical protein